MRESLYIISEQSLLTRGLSCVLSERYSIRVMNRLQDLDGTSAELPILFVHSNLLEADPRWMRFTSGPLVVVMSVLRMRLLRELVRDGAKTILFEHDGPDRALLAAEVAASRRRSIWMSTSSSELSQLSSGPSLSNREAEVARLLVAGLSDKEIAETVCLSLHGIKKRVQIILSKLDARNRTEAAVKLTLLGVVDEGMFRPDRATSLPLRNSTNGCAHQHSKERENARELLTA